MDDIEIRHEPDSSRFVIIDAGQPVGCTQYVERGEHRVFVHTEIAPALAGRGLATRLVREALTATEQSGMRIVALCPFVAHYVAEHHEFVGVMDTWEAQRRHS